MCSAWWLFNFSKSLRIRRRRIEACFLWIRIFILLFVVLLLYLIHFSLYILILTLRIRKYQSQMKNMKRGDLPNFGIVPNPFLSLSKWFSMLFIRYSSKSLHIPSYFIYISLCRWICEFVFQLFLASQSHNLDRFPFLFHLINVDTSLTNKH